MTTERKLSPKDREELLRLLRSPGKKPKGFDARLAARFGISRQRVSQLKWAGVERRRQPEPPEPQSSGPIPYRMLKDSPIQVGDYCIQVTRLYRNDGSGTSYLSPNLDECVTRRFHGGEQFKWTRSADYSQAFQEKLWEYLHTTYGEQIFPGYYPCDDTDLMESATWTFSEMLEKTRKEQEEIG